MNIQEILNRVYNIESAIDYWFVRTNYGDYFEDFTEGGYIAIGWDYFTLDELLNNNEEYVRNKIARVEGLDPETTKDKKKITSTYNKIQTFLKLKKDDIILIPSRNSDRLAFGKVIDNSPYEIESLRENGNNFKRRKVNWVEIKNMVHLNPIFFQVKSNQHSVSNINRFSPFIDKVMGNLFKKDDKTHYVLNIEKNENINFDELRILMDNINVLIDNINVLIDNINEELEFNDNLDDFYVKINLQSKGAIELIKAGKSLAILAYLLSLVSCGEIESNNDQKINKLLVENQEALIETSKVIDSLEINTEELMKPFNNGN